MFFVNKKKKEIDIACLDWKFGAKLCLRLTFLCTHLQGRINNKGKLDIPVIYFYILTKQIFFIT